VKKPGSGWTSKKWDISRRCGNWHSNKEFKQINLNTNL